VVVLPESAVVSIGGKTHVVTGVPAIPELSRVSALNVWEAEASRPLGKHGRSVAARELRRATTHGPAQ
jgi:hypothetical protein